MGRQDQEERAQAEEPDHTGSGELPKRDRQAAQGELHLGESSQGLCGRDALTGWREQNLLLAGTNTSKGTVEWAMSDMIHCPGVQKKAHEELDRIVGRNRCLEETDLKNLPYIQAIVKEVLHLHPLATTGLPHSNPGTSQLAGYTITANTTLLVNIWGIHHDPANWSDPKSFCPERFLGSDHSILGNHFDLIPFGSGQRRSPRVAHAGLSSASIRVEGAEWAGD
ncbi:flavonoid 3',5'-hydroxylase-like [Selaginella moellendorffii]|uniref:flavonoid 3',5'-hydroxylase-like n=1 Tax=Selaginella moellendorffii TaxID=88036 RepID=UPI000D1CEE64|nr:flavonoid 3',5'-hydroxylase-like [Selaginella moellendorffii]|eukprot:XP_024515306.1 flavonoid 3',5'-hydroxylase-like [Selaginella moellendorffii]